MILPYVGKAICILQSLICLPYLKSHSVRVLLGFKEGGHSSGIRTKYSASLLQPKGRTDRIEGVSLNFLVVSHWSRLGRKGQLLSLFTLSRWKIEQNHALHLNRSQNTFLLRDYRVMGILFFKYIDDTITVVPIFFSLLSSSALQSPALQHYPTLVHAHGSYI